MWLSRIRAGGGADGLGAFGEVHGFEGEGEVSVRRP